MDSARRSLVEYKDSSSFSLQYDSINQTFSNRFESLRGVRITQFSSDSTVNSVLDTLGIDPSVILKDLQKKSGFALDSLVPSQLRSDHLTSVNKQVAKLKEYSQVDSQLFNLPYDSATIKKAILKSLDLQDSSQILQIKNKELQEIIAYKAMLDSADAETLAEELPKLTEKFFHQREEIQLLQQFDQLKSQLQLPEQGGLKLDSGKIVAKEKMHALLSENQEILGEAKQKVSKLKRKYSQYNSGDSSFTLRRKEKPEKRWQFSLNLETAIRPHISAVFAPGINFNINKQWNAGVASAFDFQYHYMDTSYSKFSERPSVRLFSQYDVYKNFFVQAEYEQPFQFDFVASESVAIPQDTRTPIIWLGGGIETKLYKKIKAQTQVLYNLSSINQPFYEQKRWAIRVNLIY